MKKVLKKVSKKKIKKRQIIKVDSTQSVESPTRKEILLTGVCCAVIALSLFQIGFLAFRSDGVFASLSRPSVRESGLDVLPGGTARRMMVAQDTFVLPPPSRATVQVGNASFAVDIARTDEERKKGLSGRASLAAGTGMLFPFPQAGFHGFWMNKMQFPIDIIWIGANRTVVTVHSSVAPDTYPEVFYPKTPAQFVLEVPAGSAFREGIKKGASVKLPPL